MNKITIYSTIIASTIAILSILAFSSIQADASSPPTVSIDDISLAEGNAGLTSFTFTVTRSDNTDAISVDIVTADGTGTTADNDYQGGGGTLTFNAGGLLSKAIPVQVNGDTKVESDETFFLNLSNCVGCIIPDNQGQGTIQNDDVAPPSKVTCPEENLTIWYHLGFTVDGVRELIHPENPTLGSGSTGRISVPTASQDVITSLQDEIVGRFNELGYSQREVSTGDITEVNILGVATGGFVFIDTVCSDPGMGITAPG